MTKDEQKQETEMYKGKILRVMSKHVGKSARIPMTALFEEVFETEYTDKINSTRRLRQLLTELRREGIPICSSASQQTGGYWLASAGSELSAYCDALQGRALKMLARVAMLKKTSLETLMGQMSIEFSRP